MSNELNLFHHFIAPLFRPMSAPPLHVLRCHLLVYPLQAISSICQAAMLHSSFSGKSVYFLLQLGLRKLTTCRLPRLGEPLQGGTPTRSSQCYCVHYRILILNLTRIKLIGGTTRFGGTFTVPVNFLRHPSACATQALFSILFSSRLYMKKTQLSKV